MAKTTSKTLTTGTINKARKETHRPYSLTVWLNNDENQKFNKSVDLFGVTKSSFLRALLHEFIESDEKAVNRIKRHIKKFPDVVNRKRVSK